VPKVSRLKHRRLSLYRLLTVMHEHRDGSPVLRGDASWRTARGLMANTRWGAWVVMLSPAKSRSAK
jgi:hypothetical protein